MSKFADEHKVITVFNEDGWLIADINIQEDGTIEIIKQDDITVLLDGKEV